MGKHGVRHYIYVLDFSIFMPIGAYVQRMLAGAVVAIISDYLDFYYFLMFENLYTIGCLI